MHKLLGDGRRRMKTKTKVTLLGESRRGKAARGLTNVYSGEDRTHGTHSSSHSDISEQTHLYTRENIRVMSLDFILTCQTESL